MHPLKKREYLANLEDKFDNGEKNYPLSLIPDISISIYLQKFMR